MRGVSTETSQTLDADEAQDAIGEATPAGGDGLRRKFWSAERLLIIAIIVVLLAVAGVLVVVLQAIPREGEAPATAAQATIKRAEAATEANPESVMARLALADAYFQYQFYEEALDVLDSARSMEPTDTAQAYLEIGYARVYEATDDPASARDHYLAALDVEESFDAYYALGTLAKTDGDDEAAIDYWLKAIEQAPAAATVRVELAAIYEAQGEYDLALTQLEEAVHYIPDDPEAAAALERVHSKVQ